MAIRNRRGPVLVGLLCVIVVLAWANCPALSQEQPRRGGTLTVVTPSDISTLDPHDGYGFSSRVYTHIFEPLFQRDEKGEIRGLLAKSWRFLDPTHLQVTLRKGVKFHSGAELDAEAVKFTYERQLNPSDPAVTGSVIRMIKTPIRVVDRYTVTFETKEPNAAIVANMADMSVNPIQDPAEVKKWGKEFGLHPSGTGPFKFVEWVRNQYVKLARNPDYWGGAPYLDFLVFKVTPEDGTRVMALETGEADVLYETPAGAIRTLRGNSKIKVHSVPTYRDLIVSLNTKKPPTDDLRVRRALAQAVNVKSIFEEIITPDLGQLSSGIFNPKVFGACDVGFPLFNPEKAKQGFTELGYKPGTGGILEKGGQKLEVSLLLNPVRDPRNGEVAEAIQAQLRGFGVDVRVRAFEFATYMKMVNSAEGDYNMVIFGVNVGTGDADQKATQWLNSSIPPNGQNTPRFSNPELDRVIMAAGREMNQDQRKQLYCTLGKMYRDNVLGIPLYGSSRVTSMQTYVNGMVLHPDETYGHTYTRVWLGPKR